MDTCPESWLPTEELDVYVLGVDQPLERFTGTVIAFIHRLTDDDDKLIVVPGGATYSDEDIERLVHYQEQYFEHEIVRSV